MKTISILILMAVGCVSGSPKVSDAHATLACSDPGCVDPATGSGDATTGIDTNGWWFANGAWHVSYGGPENSVITGFSVDLIDNGPGNAKPPAPVVVSLRASRDGGASWVTVASISSGGGGGEQTLAPAFAYQPAGGEIVELMLTSTTTNPTYVVSMQISSGFPTTTMVVLASPTYVWNPPAFTDAYPLLIQISTNVGASIVGYRARVQDGGSGARAVAEIVSTDDANDLPNFPLVGSSLSSGNGQRETIAAHNFLLKTQPSTQYWIRLRDFFGTASSQVYRLEIDTI